MPLLRVLLKGRDLVADVECSKYEVKDVVEKAGFLDAYLVLTDGEGKEIGKFRLSEVVGYHWRL